MCKKLGKAPQKEFCKYVYGKDTFFLRTQHRLSIVQDHSVEASFSTKKIRHPIGVACIISTYPYIMS